MRISVFAALAAAMLLAACQTGSAPGRPAPSLTAGAAFRDCPGCPEMVVVPAGRFMMGSPPDEVYRGPEARHPVVIPRPFAVSRYEVTFDQWEACVAAGACVADAEADEGWGRGDRPAIHISWTDAKTYVAWLSKQTGQPYRLLSEAEWEYAARAGGETAFAGGPTLGAHQANFDASSATRLNPLGEARGKTLPVGQFPPNGFGLHDMHGNVWEWVEDCWNETYDATAPADGSPWLTGECGGRVLRGGSFEDYVGDIRAAARVASAVGDQTFADGLRVARDLDPPASR